MTDVQFTRYQQFYERAFSVFGDHLGAFVTDMIERDHATSTVKLYLSCINDVAKAMEATALSASSYLGL
jgi:integrase/recombinase XerD